MGNKYGVPYMLAGGSPESDMIDDNYRDTHRFNVRERSYQPSIMILKIAGISQQCNYVRRQRLGLEENT